MALLLDNKKLNDEYVVEEGYLRITNVQYNSSNRQPVYEVALYKSSEDRAREKTREAILQKYQSSAKFNTYLSSRTPVLDENTKYSDVLAIEKLFSISNTVFSSRNIILGTAQVKTAFIPDEAYTAFAELLVEAGFDTKEVDVDVSTLRTSKIEIPFTGSFGGDPSEMYLFNDEVVPRAYTELKQNSAQILDGARNDI